MTLAKHIMKLKGDTYYSDLERLCGVKAATISEIARGIRTELINDGNKNVDLGDIIAIAEAFNMSIMRLMASVHEYKDNHIISRHIFKIYPDEYFVISRLRA